MTDEAGLPASFAHHVVARVDAGGAAHAFQLNAVADVDPGRDRR